MERSWYWRFFILLGCVGVAIYAALPSFLYFTAPPEVRRSKAEIEKRIPSWLVNHRMSFGIDLQGGLHLVMGVDSEKAVFNRVDRIADEIVEEMKTKGKPVKSAQRIGETPVLEIVLNSSADYDALKTLLDQRRDSFDVKSHTGERVLFGMKDAYEKQLTDDAVAQALKTLRNRIDVYGVTEPEVRKRGTNSVLIQIAGLTAEDEKHVKADIIGKTAQLEFKIVDDESKFFQTLAGELPADIKLEMDSFRGKGDSLVSSPYLTAPTKEALQAFVAKHPPPSDRTVRYQKLTTSKGDVWRTWLLDRKTPLTGDSLTQAFVAFDSEKNQPSVAVKFDHRGAAIFDKLTSENIRHRMAIVLDDTVDSAPVIESRIPNGNCSITMGGSRSQQEVIEDAKALEVVLNAGALPAPVYPQEERTVGATLGDDAVSKGKNSLVAVAVLMMVIMIGYYRLAGVFSILGLVLNMLFLFAILATMGATLTLPGLAGLALTIGMAVDANIVQFERIREEMRTGKTARAAVDAGFDKAFSAIFDASIATLLASLVLYQYGSGPIRGFATTLAAGVVINLVTAIIVPRLCLDFVTRGRRVQQISI